MAGGNHGDTGWRIFEKKTVTCDKLALRMADEQSPQVVVPRVGSIAARGRLTPQCVGNQVSKQLVYFIVRASVQPGEIRAA